MRPWNPYSLDRSGSVIIGQTPVRLVVYGPELTPPQSAALQTAFVTSQAMARLSLVPNPSFQGALFDGSRYTIDHVGGSCTCAVWPAGDKYEVRRGVGVAVTGGANAGLFIVTYVKKKWRVVKAKQFFGGSGLWVSTDSADYLTDGGQYLAPVGDGYALRKYPRGVSPPSIGPHDTTILAGFGYKGTPAAKYLTTGLITPAGKYAQIRAGEGGYTFWVDDVDVVKEGVIALSPDTPAAVVTSNVTLTLTLPGAPRPIDGNVPPYRLRSGEGVGFPVVLPDVTQPWAEPGSTRQWVSLRHIAGAATVSCPEGGGYSVGFISGGINYFDTTDSSSPDGKPPEWVTTSKQDVSQTFATRTHGGVLLPNTGRYGSPPCGFPEHSEAHSTSFPRIYGYEEETNAIKRLHQIVGAASRLVYLSRGWNDEEIKFTIMKTADINKSFELTTERQNNVLLGMATWAENPGPEGTSMRLTSNLFAPKSSGYDTPDSPPPVTDPYRETEIRRFEERINIDMSTPWGSILQKKTDISVTYTKEQIGISSFPSTTLTKVWAASGKYERNHIIYVNPILGVIAYVNIVVNKFSVVPLDEGYYTVAARLHYEAGVAELFVLARGKTIYSKVIGSVPPSSIRVVLDDLYVGTEHRETYEYDTVYIPYGYTRVGVISPHFACYFYQQGDPPGWIREGMADEVIHIPTTGNMPTMRIKDYRSTALNIHHLSFEVPLPNFISKYQVFAATDPNSGAGVVMVTYDGNVLASLIATPDSMHGNLSTILKSGGATIAPLAISV